MTTHGPWIERLAAIAVGRELVAVAGRRDAIGVTTAAVSVVPVGVLDGKGTGWSLDAGCAVAALAFAGDELLLAGGDDGRLVAWDVTGQRRAGGLAVGAAVRSLAVDAAVARGGDGALAIGTSDGAVVLAALAFRDGAPQLTEVARHALSDGPITALAWDPAGLWVAGGADGQLRVIGDGVRAISPGGDGGIRAVACLGDGRAAIGCGDGSLRLCFIVGDVEAVDRSGDHGHQGAVRGLALGPQIVDDAGREAPRRLFTAGEDGAVKSWFVDGARRPRTLEIGIGPLTALAFAPGPVAKVERAAGRLWVASSERRVAALALGPELDPVGEPVAIHGQLAAYEALLRDTKAAAKVKLEVVAQLSTIAEDEARVLLDLALAGGQTEVRLAAIQAMVRSQRRASRPALRSALAANQPELRGAAFHALRDLEREQPLAAIRAGLAASAEDVRVRAVEALIPLARTSVIAAGLIADALRDGHPTVRRRAFAAVVEVAPDPREGVRTALGRGTPDIRAEALIYLGFVLRASDPAARRLTADAFDDADPGVRSSAFLAAVIQRPRLAARLIHRAPPVLGWINQVAQMLGIEVALPPVDTGSEPLDDDELEPLFGQLACRSPEAALRGAASLLALGDARAVGAVLQLTREADPALRRGATANLVLALTHWPADDRLTARLAWLLDDGDADTRGNAFAALAERATAGGATAELDLAELALRTSQEDIRVRALQILVRLGAPGSAVAARAGELLGDALDDEAAVVRSEAFRTLWAWHAANPLVPLARGAASRHADLRTQVISEIDRRRRAGQSGAVLDGILRDLVGDAVAAVGLAAYAAMTHQADAGKPVAIPAEVHLAAMASPAAAVRAAGALGAKTAPAASVRARLIQLLRDDQPQVQLAAVEALDQVAPGDPEGLALAWASIYFDVQVRAGELAGLRRDRAAIAPMQRLLSTPRTDRNRPPDEIRQRAAQALADVGAPEAIAYLQGLIEDDDPHVREMAARGIATAAQPGDERGSDALVALLGHADLPVRSWGGEGLAKLGDLRALPVLAGTQRHDHRPLRIGAIVGFVALGPDGVRGLRQGLEDRDREIQDLAFAVIVARDAALAALGIAPDLLVDAMSSPSAEIRFTAARLVERRASGEPLTPEVIGELVGPRKPDKAADAVDWPAPPRRAALLQVLADAIASDAPGQRYAAAQVLALRAQPLAFWREAGRLAGPAARAPAPHTTYAREARRTRRAGWLRRLVADRRDPEAPVLEHLARVFVRAGAAAPSGVDVAATQRLVFGVYAGLIRQAPARGEADETHRVRRDAIARLLELAREDAVGVDAVLPVLAHAVGDPHHLVRQGAMAALRSLYPIGALAPLQMAIAGAADLGKAAIDELVALAIDGDDRASAMIRGALDADDADVRAHAALRLPRLYPAGSAEPQLVAARSRHADVRLAAIAQLATAREPGPAVIDALVAALGSEHADLRLRAAVALARLPGAAAQGVDVLGALLRTDEHAREALRALIGLADRADSAGAAAEVIAARLDDDPERTADRPALIAALATLGHPLGAPALVRLVVDVTAGKEGDVEPLARAVVAALTAILREPTARPRLLPDGRTRARFRDELAVTHLGDAARSPLASVRLGIARALGDVDDPRAEDLLARLIGDRDPEVRVAAAEALALRAEYVPHATLVVLEAALRGGRRELVLPAALGLAARRRPEAFQPLLLVAKAGEPAEQERALLALGSLGDRRALDHLLPLLEPAPEDELARALTPAAVEALGRLVPALTGDERDDIRGRVERLAIAGSGVVRLRALTGLRYAGELPTLERVARDREERSDVRVHALGQLALAAAPTSEAVLAELLADADHAVRTAAVTALGKVLGGDRTRVSLHALGAPHDDVSAPAAAFLANHGDPATLIERIGGVRSAELRRELREGLVRRAALPLPQLAAVLAGDDPGARTEAAWIAGAAGEAARPLADAVASSVARHDDKHPAATYAALWAARRIGAAGSVAVEATASRLVGDERAPASVRRESAAVIAAAGAAGSQPSLGLLGALIGDGDREVRAVASRTLAAVQPAGAAALVRKLGSRADATTIAPLAWAAWPEVAGEVLAAPATRGWGIAVSLHGARLDELIAIAEGRGEVGGRIAALAALGRLGGERAISVLEAVHGNAAEADEIRLAAWKALKRALRQSARSARSYDSQSEPEPETEPDDSDDSDDEGDEDSDDEDEDSDDDDDDDEDEDHDDSDDEDEDDDD